ncbi:MAG: spore coat protein U domain-containing protein [Pseudoxanthomonas sp.]
MSMKFPSLAARWLPALLLALMCAFWPGKAAAQSCWANGALSLAFGTVTSAGATATSTGLSATCQSGSQTTYFSMCFYLAAGGQSNSSVNPRRMINYTTSTYMNYYLYSDAALTQLLGPVGGGYTTYELTAVASGSYVQVATPLTVYGQVPSGQSLSAGSYQEQNQTGTLYYRYSTSGYPTSCTTGGSGGGTVSTSSSGITATYADTCAISTATDLSFGSVDSLASAQDQTSTITLRCPSGTAWKLGLDNGSNASGTTRRMTDGSSHYLTYELYQDSSRSTRWGNTVGTDTVAGSGSGSTQTQTVYGRVPAQTISAAGTYSDTVTVTLTF